MSDKSPKLGFLDYSSSRTGVPLVLFIEASLCLSDCLVVLLKACLAAGVRPDGSHFCWDGAHAATTAVKGAIRITGVYIERISDSMSPALSIDVEKNGASLLGSSIIAPWYVDSTA